MNMELQARKKRKNKKWTMLWKYLLDSWNIHILHFSSVQFSHSVVFDSLWPHARQHARLPCPSPKPGACSNSCPWSQWCHPTISSSVIPFSSCLQSFPVSGSFPMSQFFESSGTYIKQGKVKAMKKGAEQGYEVYYVWDLLYIKCRINLMF